MRTKLILISFIFIAGATLFYLDLDREKEKIVEDINPEEYIGLKVEPLKIDNTSVEFPFTDDNEGESIIIKSDRKIYNGFSGSDVHISVTNTTDKPQRSVLIFYFSEDNGTISTLAKAENNKWNFINFFRENIKINQTVLSPAVNKRESMPDNFVAKAGAQLALAPGETVYLKSKVEFPPGTQGEFWVEALGDQGGYGLLDPWYNSSYSYRRAITINESMVPGTINFTNFVVLASLSHNDLRTTANGGKAASGSGEFVFTSSDGETVLDHEIDTYSATAGSLSAWVRIPTLNATSNTTLYVYYGGPNSGATNQDKTGVWGTDYAAVYHLNNIFTDSTTNARNGTNTGTVDKRGKFGGQGRDYDNDSDLIDIGTFSVASSSFTMSAWINIDGSRAGVDARIISKADGITAAAHDWMLSLTDSSGEKPRVRYNRQDVTHVSNTTISPGQWYYVVSTYNNGNSDILVNGADAGFLSGSDEHNSGALPNNTNAVYIGNQPTSANQAPDGTLDEVRISGRLRSADWILAEYNNQNAPNTYMTLGEEEALAAGSVVRIKTKGGIKIKGGVKLK